MEIVAYGGINEEEYDKLRESLWDIVSLINTAAPYYMECEHCLETSCECCEECEEDNEL